MLTSIARNAGALAVLAGLLGLVVYSDRASWSRTEVLAATGSVANDCDRPAACRASQGTFARPEAGLDLGTVMPTKSMCILSDGIGEAAAAGDAMIAQAYQGVVVESSVGDMSAGRDGNSVSATANTAAQDRDL